MKPINHSYRKHSPLMIILIMSAVFYCFFPTLKNGFVWDDEINLIDNPAYKGLSWNHLSWMFTTFHDGNYHPLCWLSWGLDFRLWGMNPAGYHLTNLVLHGLNAVLFYLLLIGILQRSSKDASAISFNLLTGACIGTLFFALHPLRVEPVAWISTRGDTLCGFFYFLAILCYIQMCNNDAGSKIKSGYWLSLIFYGCSLLSRAWGITLPVVLLIIDIYPLRRWVCERNLWHSNKKILTEKIPFALLAFAGGAMAFIAKKKSMLSMAQHSILDRLMQAAYGLCFYLWKTVVPIRLSPLYQLHDFSIAKTQYVLCIVFVFAISVGLMWLRHRWPWGITAWLCYGIIVSPLLGFTQSGPQVAADRYTYFSCLPFAVLIGSGFYKLTLMRQTEKISQLTWISIILMVLTGLMMFGMLSHRQAKVWQDNLSLWNQVIHVNPKNTIALTERARLKFEEISDLTGAETDYTRLLELAPKNTDALVSRGLARIKLGKFAEALQDFNTASLLDPRKAEIYNGLGLWHYQQKAYSKALKNYNIAIELNPNFADAFNNRGLVYRQYGNLTDAIEDFNTAMRLAPASPDAYVNRGMILLLSNDVDQAIRDFTKALDLAPSMWPFRDSVEQALLRARSKLKKKE